MKIERYKYVNPKENEYEDFLFVDEVFHSTMHHDGSDYYEPVYSAASIKDGKWDEQSFMELVNQWLNLYATADEVIEYVLVDDFELCSNWWREMKKTGYSVEFFNQYIKETVVVK